MKIVVKLTLAMVLGASGVVAVHELVRERREASSFEGELMRAQADLGHAIAAAVAAGVRDHGEGAVASSVDAAAPRRPGLSIRFLGASEAPPRSVAGDVVASIEHGSPSTLRTFVPVRVADAAGAPRVLGAIEIAEPLADEERFLALSKLETLATIVALGLVTGGLSFLLGGVMVGRPVRKLVAKMREIGEGTFSRPLASARDDELGELAREIDAMSARLDEAHRRAEAETAARLATLEQLRHADRLVTVGKLAAGVAHELGTPLNVVSGRAAMLVDGELGPEDARRAAKAVAKAAERMTRIVRQLMDFARRRPPAIAERDLVEIARAATALVEPLTRDRGATIEIDAPRGPVPAQVDGGQIEQVVTNLVLNAVQAMPSGGTVSIEAEQLHRSPPVHLGGGAREWSVLRVRDEGVGITPADLEHVFEPFFTTKDVGEGTGLGLSVVWGIVREHGGFVEVDSTPGAGSTFTVYLPRT